MKNTGPSFGVAFCIWAGAWLLIVPNCTKNNMEQPARQKL